MGRVWGEGNSGKDAWKEAVTMVQLSGPIIFANMFQYARQAFTLMYVARVKSGPHHGSLAIGAAALALSISNITGNSLICGLLLPLDTLLSQANGAGQFGRMGTVLQRGLLFTFCILMTMNAVWFNCERLLMAMGQKEDLSRVTAQFLVWLLPGVWAFMLTFALRRYLVAQQNTKPFAVISVVFGASHVLSTWLFMTVLEQGLMGAAMALSVSNLVQMLCTLAYVVYLTKTDGRCWAGWDLKGALADWGPYGRLALPASLQLFCKWWMFELIIVLAGLLPSPHTAVAAMGLSNNIDALVYYLCLGCAFATNSRVGNHLGSGDYAKAQLAGRVALAVNFVLWLGCCALILPPQMGRLLVELYVGTKASEAPTRELLQRLLPYIMVLQFADGAKEMLNSVLTATARQFYSAITAGVAYNLVGIPAVLVLGFVVHSPQPYSPLSGGVCGLWTGIVIATFVVMGLNLYVVERTDWKAEAVKARERSGAAPVDDEAAAGDEAAAAGAGGDGLNAPLLAPADT